MDLFDSLGDGRPAPKAAAAKAAPKVRKVKAREGIPARVVPPADQPLAPVGLAAVAPNVPSSDRTRCGTVKAGDACVYRSLYCGYFLAKVMAVRFMGEMVDVDVFSNNGVRILHLTRIVFRDGFATAAPGEAYIGERPKQ